MATKKRAPKLSGKAFADAHERTATAKKKTDRRNAQRRAGGAGELAVKERLQAKVAAEREKNTARPKKAAAAAAPKTADGAQWVERDVTRKGKTYKQWFRVKAKK